MYLSEPSRRAREEGLRTGWIIALTIAVVAAGCGGKSTSATTHASTTTASTAATTPASTAATTTASTSSPTTTAASSIDCNTLGINPTSMREGTCTHNGLTYVIVDENHTLRLHSLTSSLRAVHSAKSLSGSGGSATAQGQFVIVSLTITNRLSAAQALDQRHTQQFGLILDGALFKEDVGAETGADAHSCVASNAAIQPGKSETCDALFDVPASSTADLGKHGSGDVYVVDFGSDLAASIAPMTIGQIRLYR